MRASVLVCVLISGLLRLLVLTDAYSQRAQYLYATHRGVSPFQEFAQLHVLMIGQA